MNQEKTRAEQEIKGFEFMRNMAELKALSKFSLEQPLTDEQYKKMLRLKEEVLK